MNGFTLQVKCVGVKINHFIPGNGSIDTMGFFSKHHILKFIVHRILDVRQKGKPLPFIVGKRNQQKMRLLKGDFFYSGIHMFTLKGQ